MEPTRTKKLPDMFRKSLAQTKWQVACTLFCAHLNPDRCIIGIGGAHAHEAEAAPVHHAEAVEVVLLLPLPLHYAPLPMQGNS